MFMHGSTLISATLVTRQTSAGVVHKYQYFLEKIFVRWGGGGGFGFCSSRLCYKNIDL